MPSNAPDGRGAEASNEGGGEVSGLDDRDLAGLSDANLAAEVAKDKEAKEQGWKTMAFNVLGTLVGLGPVGMALGHLSLGNQATAAGRGASVAGLGPIGSMVASAVASDNPEDAAMGMLNSQVAGITGNITGDVVGGLTNSGLASMGTSAIVGDQVEGMMNSAQAGQSTPTQNQGLSNQAQSLAEGRGNTRYTTRGMFNPYMNTYVNRNLT